MTDRIATGARAAPAGLPPQPATVWLPDPVRQAIIEHAAREAPRECCGLLVGRGRIVVAAVPATNLEPGVTRFRVNEREHLRLRRAVRLVSPPLEIVGVYHSHPSGGTHPSASDVSEAYYPDWLYVVAGRAPNGGWRVEGFEIRDGVASPVVPEVSAGGPADEATAADRSGPVRTG